MQPMYTQVLLRAMAQDKVSPGGIQLVSVSEETPRYRVVAVGHGRRVQGLVELVPLKVKVDDVVLVDEGTNIVVDGEKLVLTKEDSILAIL